MLGNCMAATLQARADFARMRADLYLKIVYP